jgi:leader peptidase (prepilin peptidase)/N-methyltransferase
MGVLFAAQWFRHGADPVSLILGGILTVDLVVMSLIDYDHQIIPDELSLGLLGVGVALAPFNGLLGEGVWERLLGALLAAAFGFGMLFAVGWVGEKIWKKEAMGGGDIKLMAGLGACLGFWGVLHTLFFASFVGAAVAGVLLARRKLSRGSYIPFGPFLAMGAWATWMGAGRWWRFLGLDLPG